MNDSPEDNEEKEPVDFTKPDFTFTPGNHMYRQQGFYLVCKSCDLHHAIWIGPNKIMTGVDQNGKPILTDRVTI